MGNTIGTAYIQIAPNMTGMQGKIAAGLKGQGSEATKQLGDEINANSGGFQGALGKLGNIAKVGGIAIATGIAAGAAGMAALTGKALLAGAELQQQLGGAEAVFEGFASNMKATAADAYTKMGLSQNEFLAGANKMGSLFQGAGFSVEQSMNMSADAMQRASDVASIMGIDTTTALESVTGMAKGNFTMMDNLGVAINDTTIGQYALTKGITKSTAAMTTQEKVGLANQLFMQKTAKYAGNYAKENDSLSGTLNTTKKAFQDLLATGNASGFIDSLIHTIQLAIPEIVRILPALVQGIGATLTALVPAISAALPVLIPALINAVTSLLNGLVAAMPQIAQVLVGALPSLINAFIQIFLAIIKALPQIIAIVAGAMPAIIDAIVTGLTNPTSLTEIILGTVMLLMAMIKAIPVIITALVAAVPTIVRNIVQTLTSSQFLSAMMNASIQLFQAYISGITKMYGAIASTVGEIIKIISSTLAPSNMIRIGSDLVRGLWDGMQSMGGWMKDRVVNFVKDKIPGAIKSALGIHSPSKVAAALGREVPAGLAQGIDKNSGLVAQSATNMANDAITSMASGDLSASMLANAHITADAAPSQATSSSKTYNIYPMLGSSDAVKEFFKQLNQDNMNIGMGITPVQGAY